MARSKAHLYPKEDQLLAEFALGFTHPARIGVLRQLKHEDYCCVERICENHQLSQPAVSDHLGILYRKELILYTERFPYTNYFLYDENIEKAEQAFKNLFDELRYG